MKHDQNNALVELCEAILLLKNIVEMESFFKDLCTPQELRSFAERWRVCKLLEAGELSYREINKETGASLVTIGSVARFLKEEPNQGYKLLLRRIKKMEESK